MHYTRGPMASCAAKRNRQRGAEPARRSSKSALDSACIYDEKYPAKRDSCLDKDAGTL
jgi:hypothetical protein